MILTCKNNIFVATGRAVRVLGCSHSNSGIEQPEFGWQRSAWVGVPELERAERRHRSERRHDGPDARCSDVIISARISSFSIGCQCSETFCPKPSQLGPFQTRTMMFLAQLSTQSRRFVAKKNDEIALL